MMVKVGKGSTLLLVDVIDEALSDIDEPLVAVAIEEEVLK